ncbi:E1A [Baboon adenovirus 3]|uniref:Early E1A protein n=1 Tax=Simian mastadenovirus C TaxID=1962300 RepID=M9YVI5_9ADEN|nr:E1A [Baboon adenovirus 3]AGK27124.1 E1A [Baboon adenovirus 3]AGK27196.1 E1A [Simian mastadenovirus C]
MRLVPEMYGVSWDETAEELLNAEIYDVPNLPPGTPSLHDLFDVENDGGQDENEDAVNSMFPDSMLSAGEGYAGDVDPSGSDMDLKCYEDGLPSSSSEGSDEDEQKPLKHELVLDCPKNPGHDCRACAFHRATSGNTEAICCLCYMRLTSDFVYSDVSDVEGDGDKSKVSESPGSLGTVVPDGVLKPTAVRVSARRRQAVEKLEDLLQEPEQTEPLDLSLKQPRMT